jgi:tetratricopeptide (TPR) repeat protein
MFDWLKILGLMFVSPKRGFDAAYSHSPFISTVILLLVTQTLYYLYLNWHLWKSKISGQNFLLIFAALIVAFIMTLVVMAVFVPLLIAISNFFQRRGSFTQVIQQEFTSVATTFSYAYIVIDLLSLGVIFLVNRSGWSAKLVALTLASSERLKQEDPQTWSRYFDEKQITEFKDNPEALGIMIVYFLILPITAFFILWAVRAAFRMGWVRTIFIAIVGVVSMPVLYIIFTSPIGFVIGAPALLLISFFLLQGYFREISRRRQAETDFKQKLELAAQNPTDASAHYNLGLLYQERKDFDEARKSFEKTIEIDTDELDAYYQLGRIAREQNRLQDAINHFSQVISRSQNHAQYEVWREIGATYIAANQFSDAKDALEKFLDERPNDPEGLFLMGKTQAGLGDKNAAIKMMRSCIEAVKTAPAYKNRLEQHWLNEAEKFLSSEF